ncbi:phosphoglyceromutase [Candidatus Mycoplasma haematolamae str. Purdue]|uniref:2,3-bisphosphoglycerate-independent phosphoglycerate mutase n=1 Tax=Mycoplasma haematolamae (strain Purdue) TaxID=1212765 RepID=I7BIH2_MYCHA|nr:2,3-bisphosphoglycerate-independent phosphoglycerate mutase [Candidatus Mycoplasma haematolamae]AFO51618.1 phosphoglyceromutase [Candidatus Mycoplasma haematolamae str. Purdue]
MSSKVILTILDGWGLREEKEWNSIACAHTPNFDSLKTNYPFCTLTASGEPVGLPDGQMGNSEVGHLNIGAGRIVETGLYRIFQSIKRGEFSSIEAIKDVFSSLTGRLHILILGSKGGVHSHIQHLYAFLDVCKERGVSPIVHLFSDGRDVAPTQFLTDLEEILPYLERTNSRVGTISGRYFAMDRDKNWDRVERVLRVIKGEGSVHTFSCPKEYVSSQYKKEITDEFIEPAALNTFISEDQGLKDGDTVVFLNFRPDRAKELSHLLVGSKNLYDYHSNLSPRDISLYSLMEYENLNVKGVFFPPISLSNTLGVVINAQGGHQLRVAESEKYPHVTYFFDGGVERNLSNTKKIIVPSPKVGTYDKAPEMSIHTVNEEIEKALREQEFKLVVINFANPDMVGHSGDFEATVKACTAVDKVLGNVFALAQELGYTLLVMADHGNAEVMKDSRGLPHTAHTTNLVPFIVCDTSVSLNPEGGKLGDVAPTILDLLSIAQPSEMTGVSLLKR